VAAWLIIHGAASAGINATPAEGVTTSRAIGSSSSNHNIGNNSSNSTGMISSSSNRRSSSNSSSTNTSSNISNDKNVIGGQATGSDGFNRFGNCDTKELLRQSRDTKMRCAVSQYLIEWLHQHAIFTELILTAIQRQYIHRHKGEPVSSALQNATKKRPTGKLNYQFRIIESHPFFKPSREAPAPALCILGGHEETILALIADYVGVIRGRQLRNARLAAALLAPR
jgi:hypothetical protein